MRYLNTASKPIGIVPATLLGVAIGSFLVPAVRELHGLNFRLLFRISGDHVYVNGQPAGCTIYIVPNVQITEGYRRQCITESTRSPEALLLAEYCRPLRAEFPPAEAWQPHPLLEWGALELARRVAHQLDYEASRPASRPARANPKFLRPTAEEALDLIARAQEARPDNGALWLAEAAVRFGQGSHEAALSALRIAADRPRWDAQSRRLFLCCRDVLADEGFPCFDASTIAHFQTDWPGAACGVMVVSQTHLLRLAIQATERGDRERLGALFSLLRDLQRGEWDDDRAFNLFRGLPGIGDRSDFLEAVAPKLGRSLPERPSEAEFKVRKQAEEKLIEDYVLTYLDTDLARQLLAGRVQHERDLERARDRSDREHCSILRSAMYSSLPGALSLVLLAYLLAGLLIEVPFRFPRDGAVRRWPHRRYFWPVAVVVVIVTSGIVFLAASAVFQPAGLRVVTEKPWLTPNQHHALSSLSSCACYLALRLFLLHWGRFGSAPLLVTGYAYLALVGTTAYLRQAVIAAIAAARLSA